MTPTQLKKIRIKHFGTQAAMAEYLGIETRTIQRWEAGEYPPKRAYLLLLKSFLK